MSIATLKRKTAAQYNNMSVGSKDGGFSINGTHRSQGYVGQTCLSRSLPRTLMKGDTIRGHGGCCGKYQVNPVVLSAVTSLEDSTVVKNSVINTNGMIQTKYRWIRRPQPFAVVKPDNNNNINTQQFYIDSLHKTTVKEADACYEVKTVGSSSSKCKNLSSLNQSSKTDNCNFAKPSSDYTSVSSGEHISKMQNKCVENDIIYVVPNRLSVNAGTFGTC
jgi:hypothetical protein